MPQSKHTSSAFLPTIGQPTLLVRI